MSESIRADVPDEPQERVRVETWRDRSGKLWTAVTGRQTVWALGPAVRVTIYPRAMRLCIAATLALLAWIAWQTFLVAERLGDLIRQGG